jgi:uncharacterized membrane protein
VEPEAPPEGGEKETVRLEAFSDGVFAFAITLLVLELRVPHFEGAPGELTASWLANALLEVWPRYAAFATSFLTILIMWVHHHSLFRFITRSDLPLMFANGLLLLLVATVAFPSAVVGEYIMTPAAATAATLYVSQQVLLATAFLILLRVGFRPSSLSPRAPPDVVRGLRRSYLIGPPLYLAVLVIAPRCPKLAMGFSLALWVFWAVVPMRANRALRG